MGLLNFIVDVSSAVVKAALTPVAVVADVSVKVLTGKNPELAEKCIEGIKKDLSDAQDDIVP